jgi:hypothetical protein
VSERNNGKGPLTRPAPAGESAGRGPPSSATAEGLPIIMAGGSATPAERETQKIVVDGQAVGIPHPVPRLRDTPPDFWGLRFRVRSNRTIGVHRSDRRAPSGSRNRTPQRREKGKLKRVSWRCRHTRSLHRSQGRTSARPRVLARLIHLIRDSARRGGASASPQRDWRSGARAMGRHTVSPLRSPPSGWWV